MMTHVEEKDKDQWVVTKVEEEEEDDQWMVTHVEEKQEDRWMV